MEKFLKLMVFAFVMICGEQLWAGDRGCPPRSDSKKYDKEQVEESSTIVDAVCDVLAQRFAASSMRQSRDNARGLHIQTDIPEEVAPQVIECRWFPKPDADNNFVHQSGELAQGAIGIAQHKKSNHNLPCILEEVEE